MSEFLVNSKNSDIFFIVPVSRIPYSYGKTLKRRSSDGKL